MSCIFCDIVAGAARADVVGCSPGGVTAFLDARPVFKGHAPVVPDVHADTLVDAPPEQLAPLLAAVQ